jgi:hypothetical protein
MLTESISTSLFLCTLYLGLGMGLLVPRDAGAQDADIEASSACFEEVHRSDALAVSQMYRCPSGAVPMEVLIRSPEVYGPGSVQSALDRLVEIGLTTDSDQIQVAVCQALHRVSALKDGEGRPRVEGIVERLEDLFFSGRPMFRVFCVGAARNKADRPRMIEFLKRIASEQDAPDVENRFPASYRAIEELDVMGAEGRAAIQELLATDAIPSGRARWRAERALERGPGGGA